jgi:repressor LexA
VKLTDKQRAIFDFVREFHKRNGYPPSYDEMSAHFKVFRNCIQQHLKAIEKKGYIKRTPNVARGLVPVSRGNRRGSIWRSWEAVEPKPTNDFE